MKRRMNICRGKDGLSGPARNAESRGIFGARGKKSRRGRKRSQARGEPSLTLPRLSGDQVHVPPFFLHVNPGLPIQKLQDIQRAMELLSCQGPAKSIDEAAKHKYQFWDTQPVPKLNEVVTSHGPIEADKENIRQEPYSLPQGFMWDTLDLSNADVAVYTAGVVLPKPVSTCRYWHRSLNPRKLVEVKFSHLSRNMTLQRTMKLYRLPDLFLSLSTPHTEHQDSSLRLMERRDIRQVTELLQKYLKRFQLAPSMGEEEVAHWFLPQDNIIDTYVVEGTGGVLTDFTSFYTLPSTVMHHPLHRSLKAAYSFYNVHTQTPLLDLMNDALILAKLKGFDVFNALDLMENKVFLEKLKFGIGDGNLQYYLYNWKCPRWTLIRLASSFSSRSHLGCYTKY
ncbi:hypothetical protein INR49_007527 [Caranx melampygus]|nr:hypothetical protein INR49_007527 [Caranx melampygus]